MLTIDSPRYRTITRCMALGSFLLFANLYLFQPIMPVLAEEFSLTASQVNWVFASTTLTLALSLVIWAVISDTLGRKRIMLLGLFVPVIIHGVLLLAPSFTSLIIARALLGVALGAFAAVAMAYMAEELSAAAFTKAAGGYIAANSLGGIAGRLCGGIITDWLNWPAAVLVVTLMTLTGAVILWQQLPQEQQFTAKTPSLPGLRAELLGHFSQHIVWFAMLIGGLNFALFVNVFSVIGFRLTQAPFDLPTSISALIFLCYLTGTLAARFSSLWTRGRHPVNGILFGIAICASGVWLAWFDQLLTIVLSLLLLSAGAFFTHTLAYGWVSLQAKRGKATASALYLMHYYIDGSLGGFWLFFCWELGGWPAVIAGCMAVYLVMIGLSYKIRSLVS